MELVPSTPHDQLPSHEAQQPAPSEVGAFADVERLAYLRCVRADERGEGSIAVRPLDALRSVAYQIATGRIKASALMVITADLADGPGVWHLTRHRSSLMFEQEIFMLELAKSLRMHEVLHELDPPPVCAHGREPTDCTICFVPPSPPSDVA